MDLGKKIRDIRKQKKLTLIELSKMTGVAQATLSRIETGIMQGTAESHRKIADALGLSLAEFYSSLDDRLAKVVHKEMGEEKKVVYHTDKIKCEMLTSEAMKKKITPLLITLAPRSETHREKTERGVEKFLFALEGEVLVRLDKKEYNLKTNDTLYFDSSLPHQIANTASKPAKIFCAVSPPSL